MEFLLVIATNAHKCESIADKHRLDAFIEGRRAAERWKHIDLQDPRLLVRVNKDIEAVELEAIDARGRILLQILCHVWLHAQECFDDKVLKLSNYVLIVNALLLIRLPKHLEVPL